jgi:hypothetical protein
MGNRAYIQIDSQNLEMPILLYGHYSGEDNLTAVKNVLEKTGRVGDPAYLTAQLFYEFAIVLGQYDGVLGFGIECGQLTDSVWVDNPTVYVNADNGEYSYKGTTHTDYARSGIRV